LHLIMPSTTPALPHDGAPQQHADAGSKDKDKAQVKLFGKGTGPQEQNRDEPAATVTNENKCVIIKEAKAGSIIDKDRANNDEQRNSASGAKFRSGWSSTPKVPPAQKFLPTMEPRESTWQKRRREEKEARETAERERDEEACRLAEEKAEAARLEQERLAAEAEAKKLEQEQLAAAMKAELDRLDAEKEAKQAELQKLEQTRIDYEMMLADRRRADAEAAATAASNAHAELQKLEQIRIDHEMALAEQRKADAEESAAIAAASIADDSLHEAEEDCDYSRTETPEEESSQHQATSIWWQRNSKLLLIAVAIAGFVFGFLFLTGEDNDENEQASLSTGDIVPMADGPNNEGGTMLDVIDIEDDSSMGDIVPTADGPNNEGGATLDVIEDDASIALVVDRSCEYVKSDTVYASVTSNGVDNRMVGGISDFDGGNAVIVSHGDDGIGAVWALSKNTFNGSWEQTAFQTDEGDHFGWDVALRGDTIVVGAPAYDGSDNYDWIDYFYTWTSGRGAVFVMTRGGASGSWTRTATLLPSVADDDAGFGASVAISDCGCFLAIGAWHDKDGRGSVFVYSKTSNGVWEQTQKLAPSLTKTQSIFFHGNYGHTVAISDTLLAVKAPFDYSGGLRGVVYLYKRGADGKYEEIQRLSTPEGLQTESYHAPQVVLLDEFVLVAAHEYRKVYVFKQTSSGGYQKTTELVASDAGSYSNFGVKIGGQGRNVIVADRIDDSSYLFSYEDGVWKEKAKFDGYHAALSGNSIVVHSPFDFTAGYGSRYGGQVSFYDLVCGLL
jgi:hypothetical protein